MPDIAINFWWLALCVFFEARGEPFEGQILVAHTVMNRKDNRQMSVEMVVKEPHQFTWYNPDQRIDMPWEEFDAMESCILAAKKCLEERMDGYNAMGINYYFNPNEVTPSWARNMTKMYSVGNHDFYKG